MADHGQILPEAIQRYHEVIESLEPEFLKEMYCVPMSKTVGANEGIELEVVDPRSLKPLDEQPIVDSRRSQNSSGSSISQPV